jgi:predicted dinucleotide-binding enzyme
MRVGILGSGLMGGKLGTLFARAGHEVVFSYARTDRKLERLARDAGGKARAGTPHEAAHDADAVMLAVHWSRVNDVLKQAGPLGRTVVVSCCLPMNDNDTQLVKAHTTSGAEVLGRKLARTPLVAAFGTVPSEVLFDVYAARRRKQRPTLLYYGDRAPAKTTAARLIRDVGFEPLDAGPLKVGRWAEPMTLLVARLAYDSGRRPEMAYRFEWFHRSRK